MTRPAEQPWSISRALALLAAMFAIVFGSLMPFAALAATTPGHPIVICSAEGPQTISVGVDGTHKDGKGLGGVKCAACLLAFAAALPEPPRAVRAGVAPVRPASIPGARIERPRPPAQAPPRPPSTAPPAL